MAIFEPNVSVVKCSNIPMLVCDEAFRADPAQVDFMHVLNTLHLKDHPTLLYLANCGGASFPVLIAVESAAIA